MYKTSPFSATILSAGTLPELLGPLLFALATSHAPSIASEIRSGHNHSYMRVHKTEERKGLSLFRTKRLK